MKTNYTILLLIFISFSLVNTGLGQNSATIGEGNETQNGGMLPITMSEDYQYSWTQQIVLQSELGSAHYIGSLEFPSDDWISFSFNRVRMCSIGPVTTFISWTASRELKSTCCAIQNILSGPRDTNMLSVLSCC